MVLILDGISEHVARVWRQFSFVTTVDLDKCLEQVELPISLHTTYKPMSGLPSIISTFMFIVRPLYYPLEADIEGL